MEAGVSRWVGGRDVPRRNGGPSIGPDQQGRAAPPAGEEFVDGCAGSPVGAPRAAWVEDEGLGEIKNW